MWCIMFAMTVPNILNHTIIFTSNKVKMTSVAMLIGGAIINTIAFTSFSFVFSKLSKDRVDKERKRHDLAIEQLEKADRMGREM